jgi:hypothetical protein
MARAAASGVASLILTGLANAGSLRATLFVRQLPEWRRVAAPPLA